MSLPELPSYWLLIRAAFGFGILYFAQSAARWAYVGYKIRKQVKDLQAQGAPILLPHSWLFGHLKLIGDFHKENPKDVNIYGLHYWLQDNIERFFPGEDVLPPIIHLDLWPISSLSIILTTHPAVSAQYTQTKSLPKAQMGIDFLFPLTGGKDIATTDLANWKLWRSRLNPGFSSRNVAALLPELVEEALVFINELESLAGKDGSWGPVFQLEQKTMNLTFDVIVRASVYNTLPLMRCKVYANTNNK